MVYMMEIEQHINHIQAVSVSPAAFVWHWHSRAPAQRFGIQLPRARWNKLLKTNDLAREAVSCNAGLGGAGGLRA